MGPYRSKCLIIGFQERGSNKSSCPILLSTSWCDYDTLDLYLNVKLKYIKEAIHVWRHTNYSKEDAEIKGIKEIVEKLNTEAETILLSDEELETRRMGYKYIIKKEKWVVMDAK